MIDITTVNDPFTLEAEIPLPAHIKANRSYLWLIVILLIFFYAKNKENNEVRNR